MSDPAVPIGSLVHPHQLEVQEFSSYALVIDARSRAEYEDDHIPGAVSLPVEAEELSPLVSPLSVAEPALALPYRLAGLANGLQPNDTVLVYCARGGLDSEVWARPLRARGWSVDVLGGGWPNYRRWVTAGLESLPRALTLRVLRAPPVSGIDLILAELASRGEQVLDLATLVGARVVPGVAPRTPAVSQAAFESRILDALRQLESDRDIWIGEWLSGSPLQLPPALRDQLQQSTAIHVQVPVAERARLWARALSSQGFTTEDAIAGLLQLAMPPTQALVERWRAMRLSSVEDALVSMLGFVDAGYLASVDTSLLRPEFVLRVESLAPAGIVSAVDAWLRAGSRG